MPPTDISGALAPWLAGRLGVSSVEIDDLARRTEGFSWQTYTLTARWREPGDRRGQRGVALRRQPEDGLLAPYDIAGQYRLHEILLTTAVPVPGLIGLELDPGVLGMPFYAMDAVHGTVPVQWRGDDPEVFPNEQARHGLGLEFVDTLAAIHAIDWRDAGLDAALPGPGDGDPATAEIDRWEAFLDASVTVEVPLLRAAIGWCRANRATSGLVVLCHGDYRIGNFMVADGHIVAVFDWELAHLGDPVEDLAWAGLRLFRGRSPLVSQLLAPDEVRRRYAERTGLVIDDDVLRFWTVLGTIRAAVPHLRAATIFEQGRSRDVRLAAMGHQSLHVLRHLADELGLGGLMLNSLPRLFAGINDALTDVFPAVDDEFARVQLGACIELLGNIAARVEWRADLLQEVTRRAEEAIAAAGERAPGLVSALGPARSDETEPVVARDAALGRVSRALQWCQEHDPGADAPLVTFAVWHLEHERSLLRTGMYRR